MPKREFVPKHTFFHIGTDAFKVLMQYVTASRDSALCGEETAIITLASVIGTTLGREEEQQQL